MDPLTPDPRWWGSRVQLRELITLPLRPHVARSQRSHGAARCAQQGSAVGTGGVGPVAPVVFLQYIPLAVFYGLFLSMAAGGVVGNSLWERTLLFFTQLAHYPPNHVIRRSVC